MAVLAMAGLVHAGPAAAQDITLPRAFIGTWASKPAHCDLDGVYTLQAKGWIEGETWMCELKSIDRSPTKMVLKGPCVSEQTSERAERSLVIGIKAGRLTHIDGLRLRRCR